MYKLAHIISYNLYGTPLMSETSGVLNASLGGDREQIIPLVAQNQYQDQI